jgi:hypothetical protein
MAATDKHIRTMPPTTKPVMHSNSRGTHNIPPADKGKSKAGAGHDEGVRRNTRKIKQTILFPGLIATLIKTRTKKKSSVTHQTLKKALAEDLDDILRQENLKITPLDEPTMMKIAAFVGLSITEELQPDPTVNPTEELHTSKLNQKRTRHCNRPKSH